MSGIGGNAPRTIVGYFMSRFFKSSFVWQFAGGFVIGAIGLFVLHPVSASTPEPAAARPALVSTAR